MTPEQLKSHERDLEGIAMNIVHQIGDALYNELPQDVAHEHFVTARQKTNDALIDFTKKMVIEHTKRMTNLIFIDIPTGHEITARTMRHAVHHPDCSSKEGMICDCEIINAAQYAVDRAKARLESITSGTLK